MSVLLKSSYEMKFDPVKVVHVYHKPFDEKLLVGRLLLKSHRILMRYVLCK